MTDIDVLSGDWTTGTAVLERLAILLRQWDPANRPQFSATCQRARSDNPADMTMPR